MSSGYPTQATANGSSSNGTFYPHSVNVLSPRQGNFQTYQQSSSDAQPGEVRSVIVNRSAADSMGTPSKQQNSSSFIASQGNDLSATSPYRAMNEGITSSPYKQIIVDSSAMSASAIPAPTSMPPMTMSANSGITRVDGNVIYSSHPLTAADFGGMMMSSNGSYYQPQPTSFPGFSQMSYSQGPSMQYSHSFPQGPSGGNYMSTNPLTPRMLMGSQSLTPRGMPLPTSTQMGLTPRSYQDQMSAMMMPSQQMQSDPMLMMFAETFRNQCIAMSQYYAAHPEENVESPKSVKSDRLTAPAQSKEHSNYIVRRRMQPSLKTIQDQENFDTANATPTGEEVKGGNDAVMDLLDQLVDDESDEEQSAKVPSPRAPSYRITSPVPVKTTKTQAMFKKFACGSW